jgi:hypothetical protein
MPRFRTGELLNVKPGGICSYHLTPKGSRTVLKRFGNILPINIQLFFIREKYKTTGHTRETCVRNFRTWVSNLVTPKGQATYCELVRETYVEK